GQTPATATCTRDRHPSQVCSCSNAGRLRAGARHIWACEPFPGACPVAKKCRQCRRLRFARGAPLSFTRSPNGGHRRTIGARSMPAKTLTIAFVGDIMLGRQVNAAGSAVAPETFWGDVLPILRQADAVFANLECPITRGTQRWRRCWKAFRFRAEPHMIEVLRTANVRFVSLANNHILDCETNGLVDTLAHLDEAGIAHAGAGRNSSEAMRPAILDVAGVRVGALSLTNTMPEFAAGPSLPGTNFIRIRDDHATLALLALQIEDLRRRGAGLIVLSAHWGPNLRPWPPARFRRFARAAVELGVDVFHGHSAHILQGVELAGGRAVLYDTRHNPGDYWVFSRIRTPPACVFLAPFPRRSPPRLRAPL